MNPSLASHKHPPQRLLLVAVANHNVETGKVGKVSANKCGRKPEKEKKRKRKWERKSKDKAGGLHLSPPFFVVIAFSRNNPSPFPPLVLPFSFPHNNSHNLPFAHPIPLFFLSSFFQSINQSTIHLHRLTPVAAAFCQQRLPPHAPCIDAIIITNEGNGMLISCQLPFISLFDQHPTVSHMISLFRVPVLTISNGNIETNTRMLEMRAN
jgi:hypothetical protein